MNKKNLYILAPNDRFNYGDLLFSKILGRYFKKEVDNIYLCSTSDSDLTSLGGDVVSDERIMLDAPQDDRNYLIVAGGESLMASWMTILSFIYPSLDRFLKWMKKTKLLNRYTKIDFYAPFINGFLRIKYHLSFCYPFTIGRNELPAFNGIFYNSLGGSWLSKKGKLLENKKNRKILKSVDYIAVRDELTEDALSEHGIESTIVADSAILMSEYFDESFLSAHISRDILSKVSRNKYIFFQVNLSAELKYKEELLSVINKLQEKYNVSICLCPIGTAPGHSDDIALQDLFSQLKAMGKGDDVLFVTEPTVWDIMWLIKNAKLYVGMSLHGCITSMSYGTPFICHTSKKLKAYIDYWVDGEFNGFCKRISDIPDCSDKAIMLGYNSNNQKESVYKSFEKMKALMNNH